MTSFWCFYCWLWPESLYQYSVSIFNFSQVFVSRVWKISQNFLKTEKARYLLCTKTWKAYFIPRFIIVPNWNKLWTNDHTMNILQGPRELFRCMGDSVKTLATMVGRRRKTKKNNRLKRPKAVPKNDIWTKIWMIQNLIFTILFLKNYLGHTTFLYSSTRPRGHHQSFFIIFRFPSRVSKPIKTSEKDQK